MTSPDPAFEARVRAVLDLMASFEDRRTAAEVARRHEARVRATLAESDAADRGRDHQDEWPEPEGAFGLGRDMPCLAQAIRG